MKIILLFGVMFIMIFDLRCIVCVIIIGIVDGDVVLCWIGIVWIVGFYVLICNVVWDGNVSFVGKDELIGKVMFIFVEISCLGKVVVGEFVLKGNVGLDSFVIIWVYFEFL